MPFILFISLWFSPAHQMPSVSVSPLYMHATVSGHLPAQLPRICLIIIAVLSLNLQSNYKMHVSKLCE